MMRRTPWTLLLIAGCHSDSTPPAVLQEAEFKSRIAVELAEPLDPGAALFTLHRDGRITWKGAPQTRADILNRASSSEKVNRTPILFEVEPEAPFSVVRDALQVLTSAAGCANCAFLVDAKAGPGAVVLPIQVGKGFGYHVVEGRQKEVHIGKWVEDRYLEVVVTPSKAGEINVVELNYDVPGAVAMADGSKPPRKPWTGAALPPGIWTREMLRAFLARADVVERLPYILFKVTAQEPASNVVHCLAALRTIKDITIVPWIPTE